MHFSIAEEDKFGSPEKTLIAEPRENSALVPHPRRTINIDRVTKKGAVRKATKAFSVLFIGGNWIVMDKTRNLRIVKENAKVAIQNGSGWIS